jgi:transaldolase
MKTVMKMEIFIDTSNISEIKEFMSWGVISGVTTNPKILVTDGNVVNYENVIREICRIVYPYPVSIEVLSENVSEMIEEGERYSRFASNTVIKFPTNEDGLKAIKHLSERRIPVNATACMSAHQAFLAALAGAKYVSIFYGRVGDLGMDAMQVVRDAMKLIPKTGSKLICGSMRSVKDVVDCLLAGTDIVTITPPLLKKMMQNPKTDEAIKEFNDSFRKEKMKK